MQMSHCYFCHTAPQRNYSAGCDWMNNVFITGAVIWKLHSTTASTGQTFIYFNFVSFVWRGLLFLSVVTENLRTCILKAVKAEQEVCKAWWVRDTVCVVVLQRGFTFSVIRLTLEVCLQSVWSSGHSHFLPNCSLVKPNCYISKSRQLTTEHILS